MMKAVQDVRLWLESIRDEVIEIAGMEERAKELEDKAGPSGAGTVVSGGGAKSKVVTPIDHATQLRCELDVYRVRLEPQLEFATSVLYGRSGRGGLAKARTYADADILTGYYLQGRSWAQVAKELSADIESKWPAQWCRSRAMGSITAMERIELEKLADS